MTEAIIVTLIIVSSILALAWLVLHFGYKAWRAERADAAEAAKLEALLPPKVAPSRYGYGVMNVSAAPALSAEEVRRAADNHVKYGLRNA